MSLRDRWRVVGAKPQAIEWLAGWLRQFTPRADIIPQTRSIRNKLLKTARLGVRNVTYTFIGDRRHPVHAGNCHRFSKALVDISKSKWRRRKALMSQLVVLQFVLSLLAGLLGGAAGWWLRGRPKAGVREDRASSDRDEFAKQALQSLHAAAESVRTAVEQHIECIRALQAELREGSASEPTIINNAAASIVTANGLIQHQFNDLQKVINSKKNEISDRLHNSDGLLFTFASLDRQKHAYRQVLSSLEQLAVQLVHDVEGHGRQLRNISSRIESDEHRNLDSVNGAVEQILDATEDVQRRVEVAEKRIEQQAETVQMQAILSHTDVLTSLPNRRAFEAELEKGARTAKGKSPLCTVFFIDLDHFTNVNNEYGHQGGDVVLRQSAGLLKELVRGQDLVTRYGGDTFAVLLPQTTVHDALPIAERIRKQIEGTEFSHGSRPLRVTASIGIAQLHAEEIVDGDMGRVDQALDAAKHGGGNICFRHDGQACFPVSSVFQTKEATSGEESLSLAALWRDSSTTDAGAKSAAQAAPTEEIDPTLSGRSLFAANLSRRLSEWRRGGSPVSVALVQVDQMEELIDQFGEQGQTFLRQVMGRLLEAATRDMDERCEFEDGLFALILPGTDETIALAVAERLRSQVRQCKVRMGHDLWDLTASIGVAHCTVASRVMDIMLSAEAAMTTAAKHGGDAIRIGQPIQEPSPVVG
jgi:diguanylate cyclase